MLRKAMWAGLYAALGAAASGGVKAKVGAALAEDPEFLRKLKRQSAGSPATPPSAPSGPQLARPKKIRSGSGPSPWLVIGAALAGGYLLAKALDWRGHAHPRV